jgi:uncharacterized protein YdbL (DUF1318 family)
MRIMSKQIANIPAILKFFITTALLFSSLAMAVTLDEAKQKGLVGEQKNGYVGIVIKDVATEKLVADINAKRKAKFTALAAKNNITLQDVEKLAAKKTYAKTQKGHFLQINGVWQKK